MFKGNDILLHKADHWCIDFTRFLILLNVWSPKTNHTF